ncbi:MAG TPA: hypothetical protein VKR52_18045 [Terracidiphilus sp.]|nr:hypothetical protein [Terracidiphilus sp.]
MIRQAISCDICGAEMQHTHRCFVAFDKGTELRVSGWIARRRMHGGALHLCGQKCLHKLVDQFMARTLAAEPPAEETAQEGPKGARVSRVDGSLTSLPARLVSSGEADDGRAFEHAFGPQTRLVTREQSEDKSVELAPDHAGLSTRAWGSAAWQREREREQREAAAGHGVPRRSIA